MQLYMHGMMASINSQLSLPHALCRGYMLNKIISAFVDVRLKWVWFTARKPAWNYFKIVSEAYCSLWVFSNIFIVQRHYNNFEIILVAEIILK